MRQHPLAKRQRPFSITRKGEPVLSNSALLSDTFTRWYAAHAVRQNADVRLLRTRGACSAA